MASLHPSEDPQLGWLVPCLAVADLAAALAFYEALGFSRVGGDPDEGWAILRSRATELHLFGRQWLTRDLLNFRGGDLGGIEALLARHDLAITHREGPASFTLTDPDGRHVFFDIGPDEVAAYQSGQPLTVPIDGALAHGDGPELGNLTWCLASEHIDDTLAFYEALGFVRAGGHADVGWAILARRDHPPAPGQRMRTLTLSVFEGMVRGDLFDFRGGDVTGLVARLAERQIAVGSGVVLSEDGGQSIMITDPDGRMIFFDTTPDERLNPE